MTQRDSFQLLECIRQTIAKRLAALTSTFTNVLAPHGTLTLPCESPSRAYREPLRRRARGVASVMAILMSMGLSPADGTTSHSFTSKDYIKSLLPKDQALCLIRLYGKESAFNRLAIGNLNGSIHTYGIPQLKNPLIAHMSAYNQIDYGIKYIEHRYEDACDAYAHWVRKGWH